MSAPVFARFELVSGNWALISPLHVTALRSTREGTTRMFVVGAPDVFEVAMEMPEVIGELYDALPREMLLGCG